MSEAALSNWLLVAAVLAGLAGMGWLALSMPAHAQQVWGRGLSSAASRVLRWLGTAGIGMALLLCLRADHPSMAVLVWVMTLAFSALVIAMSLSGCPRALRALAPWAGSAR
ncbi:MAG: DUF3325 domain-containing protein [Achromobacter sp.]|uniref:DUF3325 domain-containing protein n=1 Tax=Achromobacter sp. TaxID=134375 RepID=UPI00258C876F|nr:DUF3325 domain-containing protein [Achromobacter sp.]MCW0209123.1 DUF3325 domain-containing protein [Achromobacter sp.]